MNKEETIQFLYDKKIKFEITEHKAVYNMEEVSRISLPYPEANAKNLFVRDNKKRNYYLITIKGEKKVNLKEFKIRNNTRSLSFATEEELLSILKLEKGAVTPLGLLNDQEIKVEFYLDDSFLNYPQLIGVHPNDNTATIWLNTRDLLSIIEEHGNLIHVVPM
ncbi:MAG: prolyl-tRNA synthetase associated domain-containing protein [Tissierellia bacterium]|nr:prolyl-tRNA synthetase associated domain-containing protein [Tissierellia bacterium]